VSDKKIAHYNANGVLDYYTADVVTANDYYPGGMVMPERKYPAAGGLYRYGFNGKEKDLETTSTTTYDYGFRIYSPGLGRFLSVDPLFKSYPELTPYQFASNNPIEAIDLDGLEAESSKKEGFWKSFGKSVLRGIGNAISYVANNPNHAGYGNGVQPSTGKPPTQADFKKYDFSFSDAIDPTLQIQNFSNNLVFGTTNFVGGIIDGDGARTAQAIPQLFSAVGTMYGVSKFLKTPSIPLVNTAAGLSELRLTVVGNELAAASGKKPYIISAVTDAKSGKTFIGANKGIKSLDDVHAELKARLPAETLENWKTFNCAECDAFNKALKAGAKWEDLGDLHTKQWDNAAKKYVDVKRCDNCQVTFKDKTPTSE
jgi:RHS repeat-associated protein